MFLKLFLLRVKHFLTLLNRNTDYGLHFVLYLFILVIIDIASSYYIICFYLYPILIIHFKRLDQSFITKMSNQRYMALLTDYFVITSFITAVLLIKEIHQFHVIIAAYLLCFVYPLFKTESAAYKNDKLISQIPFLLLEWRVFLREKPITFLLLYVALIICGLNSYLLYASFFLWLNLNLMIYSWNEPKEVLCLCFKRYRLYDKITSNALFISTLAIPQLALALFFIDEPLISIIVSFFVFLLISALSLSHKYARYSETNGGNANGAMIKYSLAMSLILPALALQQANSKIALKKIKNYVTD